MDLSADLRLALAAADIADRITLPPFATSDVEVGWKPDDTEVSDIDRRAEGAIVDHLLAARPGHGAFGEEHGPRGDADGPWRWVIDPIDGTSGYVRGIPVWASLIGLTHTDSGAVLGVVSAPALGRRWWGGVGLDAHVAHGGASRPMCVSDVADLGNAQVSVTHSPGWDALGLTPALLDIERRSRRARGLGDFWQHMLVAEGAVDVAIDAIGVASYDLAAIQPIVEAAGGAFTDRLGVPTHEHDSAISSNRRLHRTVIDALVPPST